MTAGAASIASAADGGVATIRKLPGLDSNQQPFG